VKCEQFAEAMADAAEEGDKKIRTASRKLAHMLTGIQEYTE
jgi:hypothetical protein